MAEASVISAAPRAATTNDASKPGSFGARAKAASIREPIARAAPRWTSALALGIP